MRSPSEKQRKRTVARARAQKRLDKLFDDLNLKRLAILEKAANMQAHGEIHYRMSEGELEEAVAGVFEELEQLEEAVEQFKVVADELAQVEEKRDEVRAKLAALREAL